MKVLTDLFVNAGDEPNRRWSAQGRHYIELCHDGPVLLLAELVDDDERLRYLSELARQCLLLAGDIERAAGRQP